MIPTPHVSITANGEYRLDQVVAGDMVTDVLQYVAIPAKSCSRACAALERALQENGSPGRITSPAEDLRRLACPATYLDTEKAKRQWEGIGDRVHRV